MSTDAAQTEPQMARYRTPTGKVLFVTDGISAGRSWFTAYKTDTGSTKRLVSKMLPIRQTRKAAQLDLDRYAGHFNYRVIS